MKKLKKKKYLKKYVRITKQYIIFTYLSFLYHDTHSSIILCASTIIGTCIYSISIAIIATNCEQMNNIEIKPERGSIPHSI